MSLTFGAPAFLVLLVAPAALLLAWGWRWILRRRDLRVWTSRRVVPARERFRAAGELPFWLCLIAAVATLIVALARPLAPTAVPQRAGLDLVILQDASASMRVQDVARRASGDEASTRPVTDRWQRSLQFLREIGDAMNWQQDRLGMTVFAHVATPQIRLTRDPNTLFFFLDHLHERPPFRLEDDTTWDTNLELAVGWGLRLVDKDAEIHGRSRNAVAFVMLSDGEAWSGEVAQAVERLSTRGIPLYVVGVGTLAGGALPAVATDEFDEIPSRSRLERAALQRIAAAGHARYFELDRDGDRHIANTIVSEARRLVAPIGVEERAEELYWWFLAGAAAFAGLGLVFLPRRADVGLVAAGAAAAALLVGPLLW